MGPSSSSMPSWAVLDIFRAKASSDCRGAPGALSELAGSLAAAACFPLLVVCAEDAQEAHPRKSDLRSHFGSSSLERSPHPRGRMERLADALTGSPVRPAGEVLLDELFGDDDDVAGGDRWRRGVRAAADARRAAAGVGGAAAGARTGGATSPALPLLAMPTFILAGPSSSVYCMCSPGFFSPTTILWCWVLVLKRRCPAFLSSPPLPPPPSSSHHHHRHPIISIIIIVLIIAITNVITTIIIAIIITTAIIIAIINTHVGTPLTRFVAP